MDAPVAREAAPHARPLNDPTRATIALALGETGVAIPRREGKLVLYAFTTVGERLLGSFLTSLATGQ